jgi:hypothetical protein
MSEDLIGGVAPWDIRPSDTRIADSVSNFIVFCEDSEIEPLYFKSFEKAGVVKVNEVPNQKHGLRNVNNAITKCVNDGLMVYENGAYRRAENITENIWCVFDRDTENQDPAQVDPANNLDFDNAITFAGQHDIPVAWSNDVFELWFLLHFEDVAPGVRLHRTQVYDRLTDILRGLHNKSAELLQLTANAQFHYKPAMKTKRRFLTITKPLLNDKINDAIGRAIQLETAFDNRQLPPHLQNPCTKIHHLIQALILAQQGSVVN